MLVINYPDIHEKIEIGDKILVDQGGVLLTVIAFESEDQYLNRSKVTPSTSGMT
jgi:pyruvate kinase